MPINHRRRMILGGALLSVGFAAKAGMAAPLAAETLGVEANGKADQTKALRKALEQAAKTGRTLELAAGSYKVSDLELPTGARLRGAGAATRLLGSGDKPILRTREAGDLVIEGLAFDAGGQGPNSETTGLVMLENCTNVAVSNCRFVQGAGSGLRLHGCSGRIAKNHFSGFGETALFCTDSTGLLITENTLSDCGNGGIRIFRYEKGYDGTLVTQNRISNIRSGSGNGQNGNGINVFLASNVVVANNVIADCDFSAIRLNTTDNCQVLGNNCQQCREVAIFSEFAFSGSIIANNVVADAATGISITNLDDGGRLAVCAGNVVRDITPHSPTNPDTRPVGIFAEADCAVTGNAVDNVPGIGIQAGWGPYLRNVGITGNVVSGTVYGIGVSVADGAGRAHISGNIISGATKKAISGFAWQDERGTDLANEPDQFKNVTVSGNTVS